MFIIIIIIIKGLSDSESLYLKCLKLQKESIGENHPGIIIIYIIITKITIAKLCFATTATSVVVFVVLVGVAVVAGPLSKYSLRFKTAWPIFVRYCNQVVSLILY